MHITYFLPQAFVGVRGLDRYFVSFSSHKPQRRRRNQIPELYFLSYQGSANEAKRVEALRQLGQWDDLPDEFRYSHKTKDVSIMVYDTPKGACWFVDCTQYGGNLKDQAPRFEPLDYPQSPRPLKIITPRPLMAAKTVTARQLTPDHSLIVSRGDKFTEFDECDIVELNAVKHRAHVIGHEDRKTMVALQDGSFQYFRPSELVTVFTPPTT